MTRVVSTPVSDCHAPTRGGRVGTSVSANRTKGARVSEITVGSPPVVWIVAGLLAPLEGGPDGAALYIGQACEVRLQRIISNTALRYL